MVGWGHGHGVVMDKHYRLVASIQPGSYQASSDMHEFFLLPDGKSALVTQYLRSAADLCGYDICNGIGYIQEGAFQEIDVESGEVIFEWRSLAHIDFDEGYVLPGTTEISGDGRDPQLPWDYFHINSIDKNADGDYLVSARHVSCIYKISGKDGHVIWRLNGARSNFRLVGFDFSFQHDARFISEDEHKTVISLFDNGSNGYNYTQDYPQGLVVVIDHATKIATKIREYDPPELYGFRIMAESQGNMQILPNGNVVVGWGKSAYLSEHLADGTPVFYATIGFENVMNYRTHKFNWTGEPLTKPALWTYSRTGTSDDGMIIYASWNGATEVRHWNLYTGREAKGPWTKAATFAKKGFETILHHDFAPYSYIQALDEGARVLSQSEVQKTFVPSVELRPNCDDWACVSSILPDEEAEALAAANAEKAEEDERLRKEEEERLQEERATRARARRKWYMASFGALGVVVVVAVLLLARNSAWRPLAAVGHKVAYLYARAVRRAGSGRGSYKELAMDERARPGIPLDTS